MLRGLSIRDVVLIDRLDITFDANLCVLTGETGAGKSILLDSLGLALGARSEARLIRAGANRASVTAELDAAPSHPVYALLEEQGIDVDGPLLLRRVLSADGRTRAFINDQPASVGLLRQIGDMLVEVQGQFEQRGLLDPATHRAVLDAFGALTKSSKSVSEAFDAWRSTEEALARATAALEQAKADESYLRHAVEELRALAPEEAEEERLQTERHLLMNSEKLIEALNAAAAEVSGPPAVDDALRMAQRHLERMSDKAAGAFDGIIDALDRAAVEATEAITHLQGLGNEIDADGNRLQTVDDRLFALRDLARKHRCQVDDLAALLVRFEADLAALDDQDASLEKLEAERRKAHEQYRKKALALSKARSEAAARLDTAVAKELPPLKLEKARFATRIDRLEENDWTPDGMDRVQFEIATNPGSEPGPLHKIASGGELARFLLALKVVIAAADPIPTLVFDEVDSGIGGATAAAVGERLAKLGDEMQVLVVTHSPQVAALGSQHWRVQKSAGEVATETVTHVERLVTDARREEIARMLSGRDITEEARAAADVLIAGSAA